jgi:hypothetical protein
MSAELCGVNSTEVCADICTSATEMPNKSHPAKNFAQGTKGNPPEKSQRLQLLRERQHQRLEARIDAVIRESDCTLDHIDEVETEEAA